MSANLYKKKPSKILHFKKSEIRAREQKEHWFKQILIHILETLNI